MRQNKSNYYSHFIDAFAFQSYDNGSGKEVFITIKNALMASRKD